MVTNFVMVMDMSHASHEQMRGFIEVGLRLSSFKLQYCSTFLSGGRASSLQMIFKWHRIETLSKTLI